MNCPYCLSEIKKIGIVETTGAYNCPVCKTIIPRGYVEEGQVPKSTVGVVGFSGHGKTVYLTSLFSTFDKLSKYWDGFYFRSLDDYTHRILYEQVRNFNKGQLPESTPANFPNPALINYNRLPAYDNAYLAFYDTAGEVFNDTAQISRAGYFVAHSDVVLFIISLADCDPDRIDDDMSRLLDTYIRAVYDTLNVDLKTRQQIIVILSKADIYAPRMPEDLREWLQQGDPDWYVIDLAAKLIDLQVKSSEIEEWLRNEISASRFINMINDNFRSVRYTMVSATGFLNTEEIQGDASFQPRRVLDPFFLILDHARLTHSEKRRNTAVFKREVKGVFTRLREGLAAFRARRLKPKKNRKK